MTDELARPLVIFDCDGVLVDSEPISNRILSEAIGALGWTMSYEETRRTFQGRTLADVQATVEGRLGRTVPKGWLEDFKAERRNAFHRELVAVPGAADAVLSLRQDGVGVCVASQASVAKMQLTLGLTGLVDFFEPGRLFSSTMVTRPKPAPDLFLHAAAICGHAPESCIVIEDSVLGARAARAAGMRTLGYAADSDPVVLAAAGAEVFHDMHEVPSRVASPRRPRVNGSGGC